MDDEDCNLRARKLHYAAAGIQAIERFGPSQLITADDLNELVDALKELERRLTDLETRCDG